MKKERVGQSMTAHERAEFVSAVQEVAGRFAGSLFDAVDYFPRLTEFGVVVVGLLGGLTGIARSVGSPVGSVLAEAYEDAAHRLETLRALASSPRQ